MKEIEELAVLGTADIEAITPKVIADVIEEVARHKRIWAQFYKEDRQLERTGGNAVVYPKKGSGITAAFGISPGQGLTATAMVYTGKTITVAKGGVGIGISGEAIRQANRDVIRDQIQEAGEVWADVLDAVAYEAMFPRATVSTATAGTVTIQVGGNNVFPISYISVSGSGNIEVTSSSAKLIATGGGATIVFNYIPTTAASKRVSANPGSLSAKDILLVRNDIIAAKRKPDVLVIHPNLFADILYDPAVKFLEKSAYEGQGAVFTGEIGQIFGVKTIVSNKAPRYGAVVLDSSALGYHVIRLPLKLVRDDYTGASMDVLYYWGFAEENFGVVNDDAYGAVALAGTFPLSSIERQP